MSNAIHTIDAAMSGSTIEAGTETIPNVARPKVNECARVKQLTCNISCLNPMERKNRPRTNTMWSRPLGIMCWKPSAIHSKPGASA